MTQPETPDLCELFFKMEENYSLFELRTTRDFPIWDIVRNQMWYKLIYKNPCIENKLDIKTRFINLLKAFSFFPKIFFHRKKIFFYGASRFINKNNEYYDPFFEAIKKSIDDNFIFYETITGKDIYAEKNHIYPILPYLKKPIRLLFLLFKPIKKNIDSINKIAYALNITFRAEITTIKEINAIYLDFLIDYYFFKYLFYLLPWVKCVLMHQNGFQKGFILGTQHNNIKVLEFQHADIIEANIVWHYGYNKFKSKNDIIFPNFFLTFSNVWSNNYNIPCSSIEIGSKHYNVDKNWIPNSKNIGIISTKEHEEVLNLFVIEAAKSNPDIGFLYKLHPGQFSHYDKFTLYFQGISNVKIVPIESNIKDLMCQTNEFIVIYSSVIFELLQANKIVYIYKKLNYWFFKRYYTLPNVYLFNDLKDFNLQRNNASKSHMLDFPIKFFKPFNENVFKSVIENFN